MLSFKSAFLPRFYTCRHSPNKRWHIDTMMKVLTSVRSSLHFYFSSAPTKVLVLVNNGYSDFDVLVHEIAAQWFNRNTHNYSDVNQSEELILQWWGQPKFVAGAEVRLVSFSVRVFILHSQVLECTSLEIQLYDLHYLIEAMLNIIMFDFPLSGWELRPWRHSTQSDHDAVQRQWPAGVRRPEPLQSFAVRHQSGKESLCGAAVSDSVLRLMLTASAWR